MFVTSLIAGTFAPLIVWASLRYGPQVIYALLTVAAWITAIVSPDDKRRESCHKVLDMAFRRDNSPPRPQGNRRWPVRPLRPGPPQVSSGAPT